MAAYSHHIYYSLSANTVWRSLWSFIQPRLECCSHYCEWTCTCCDGDLTDRNILWQGKGDAGAPVEVRDSTRQARSPSPISSHGRTSSGCISIQSLNPPRIWELWAGTASRGTQIDTTLCEEGHFSDSLRQSLLVIMFIPGHWPVRRSQVEEWGLGTKRRQCM